MQETIGHRDHNEWITEDQVSEICGKWWMAHEGYMPWKVDKNVVAVYYIPMTRKPSYNELARFEIIRLIKSRVGDPLVYVYGIRVNGQTVVQKIDYDEFSLDATKNKVEQLMKKMITYIPT